MRLNTLRYMGGENMSATGLLICVVIFLIGLVIDVKLSYDTCKIEHEIERIVHGDEKEREHD